MSIGATFKYLLMDGAEIRSQSEPSYKKMATFRLPSNLLDEIDFMADTSGISRQRFVEMCLFHSLTEIKDEFKHLAGISDSELVRLINANNSNETNDKERG